MPLGLRITPTFLARQLKLLDLSNTDVSILADTDSRPVRSTIIHLTWPHVRKWETKEIKEKENMMGRADESFSPKT